MRIPDLQFKKENKNKGTGENREVVTGIKHALDPQI